MEGFLYFMVYYKTESTLIYKEEDLKILTKDQAVFIEEKLVSALTDFLISSDIHNIVLGNSGGLDSSLMTAIGLKSTARTKSKGYQCGYIIDFINIESNKNDLVKAQELAKKLNFKLNVYNYTFWYRISPIRLKEHLKLNRIRVAKGNLKCRIRMLHLYDRAQLYSGVVLDTDDLSELLMGFWTKHGDVGDVKLIQFLSKDEVRDLAEHMGVCKSILESAPGDGLGITPTNKASDQLGMSYLKIDYVMSRLIQNGLDINGHISQLYSHDIWVLFPKIAEEIGETAEKVMHVANQSLKTAFKRVGDDAVLLIKDRTSMGLPELGTEEFNKLYSKAIWGTNLAYYNQ